MGILGVCEVVVLVLGTEERKAEGKVGKIKIERRGGKGGNKYNQNLEFRARRKKRGNTYMLLPIFMFLWFLLILLLVLLLVLLVLRNMLDVRFVWCLLLLLLLLGRFLILRRNRSTKGL